MEGDILREKSTPEVAGFLLRLQATLTQLHVWKDWDNQSFQLPVRVKVLAIVMIRTERKDLKLSLCTDSMIVYYV